MLKVTELDLSANLNKYLRLASKEDIVIVSDGADIAMLVAPNRSRTVDELIGIAYDDGVDYKSAREERLSRHERND